MSDDPVGIVLGLGFGGFVLLLMASALNPITTINLATWGWFYLLAAAGLAVLLIVGLIGTLFGR